jgi:hypothetical protein
VLICRSDFSIINGGKASVTSKTNARIHANNETVAKFCKPLHNLEVILAIAAEVSIVYHGLMHHRSYFSQDCGI